MTDVFISYKRRLRPRVEEIATALRALGLTVWYDASLEAGSSFSAEISNEVRTAKCVLVCWSDDAFPHGGDKSGWVVGEATIGQGRERLVPVLLEAAELDPPWNTIHTESLIGWSPGTADQSGWRGMLAAIGRHVGRPDLVGEAAEAVPAVRRRGPTRAAVAIAALAGAVFTAIGIVVLMGIDPEINGRLFEIYGGAAVFGLLLAVPFWRAGRLWLPGVLLIGAGVLVALLIAYYLAVFAITPIAAALPGPAYYDVVEAIFCAIAGFVGAALSLAVLPALGLVPRTRGAAGRIVAASLALGLLAASIALLPFFDLASFRAANLWVAPPWQLGFALALVFVLGTPPSPPASPVPAVEGGLVN